LLFFCLPLIAVMLGRTIAFGSSIEAMIRTNAQGNAALEQFIMDNHIELHAVLPGSAWSALSLLMICLFAGFAANVLAWHRSSKPMGALTVLCYAVAAFAAPWRQFAPTICFTLLPALLFSALSCYALAMAPPVKRSVSRSVKRPQRGTVSGGRFQ
jgi:hypothetical protein